MSRPGSSGGLAIACPAASASLWVSGPGLRIDKRRLGELVGQRTRGDDRDREVLGQIAVRVVQKVTHLTYWQGGVEKVDRAAAKILLTF